MKRDWYEYERYTDGELEEMIDTCEGLRHPQLKLSTQLKMAYLELEVAARKLQVVQLAEALGVAGKSP